MKSRHLVISLLAASLSLTAHAATKTSESWVERSNRNAQILVDVMADQNPEFASQFGVEGYDTEILQIPPDLNARSIGALEGAAKALEAKLAEEKDPAVRQDLDIMIETARDNIEGIRIGERNTLPYVDLAQLTFLGLRALLDDQVAPERRGAALVRLRRYAGMEKGYTPITHQATAAIRAKLPNSKLSAPYRDSLEKDLSNSKRFVDGIGQLFQKYQIAGYEEPYAELRKQLDEYEAFLRKEVMPRARPDFRLAEEQYRFNLKQSGIDMPVEELVSRAKTSFREIQNEMQALAVLVAKEKGFKSNDYRDVIRELKKQQVTGDAILPLYEKRIADMERLIKEGKVLTLPNRKAKVRLASEAESASTPAPSMRIPRMVGNTGELGEFVLPLRIPGEKGKESLEFDDFTFDAAAWTLTAHEARPGHELQFASIVEKGVSLARGIFALNSTNAEGWGLYMEAEMKPVMPLDGQLISLQHRLMRAARAYLDPGLQLGMIERDEAKRILEKEVVLSPAMALQEVERYTFWAPGQAPSYFCGYSRLMEMRTDAERMLGEKFDRQSYHDFILAQGMLSPTQLRKAVMEDYVKPRANQK